MPDSGRAQALAERAEVRAAVHELLAHDESTAALARHAVLVPSTHGAIEGFQAAIDVDVLGVEG